MSQPDLVIFDDRGGHWGPMTDLRAAFDLRSGAQTNKERIERCTKLHASALWIAQDDLAPLVAREHGKPVNASHYDKAVLAVNGRWAGVQRAEEVRTLDINTALVQDDGEVVAAHLSAADAQVLLPMYGALGSLAESVQRSVASERLLMNRPWHLLDELEANLGADLAVTDLPRLQNGFRGAICFGDHPVYVAEDAVIQPGAVFNTELGPIVVESKAIVGAVSVLEGPCYIGRETTVVCHAHIRPNAVVGPMCKAAGEISHSIIHSYSNKAHHGYMGHALVGKWVNIGAATNMSNLKNTYGCVRVQLESDTPPEDTGRVFNGPLIGDTVRTAIGTRLLTGSCLSTGAMIAHSGFPPKFLPRLSFLTDKGLYSYDFDKYLITLRRMMARRNVELSPELEARLRAFR